MRWKKKEPTRAGWYFIREPHQIEVERLNAIEGGVCWYMNNARFNTLNWKEAEFAGPIPEPEDE